MAYRRFNLDLPVPHPLLGWLGEIKMADHSHAESRHHVVPAKVFFNVFVALVVLTVLTVVFHEMHLGAFAAPVAFLIATAKATLVLMYFMHLKYDNMTNRVIFLSGFFFLALLFFFCFIDIFFRIPVVETL